MPTINAATMTPTGLFIGQLRKRTRSLVAVLACRLVWSHPFSQGDDVFLFLVGWQAPDRDRRAVQLVFISHLSIAAVAVPCMPHEFDILYFCDESRQVTDHHMAVGA